MAKFLTLSTCGKTLLDPAFHEWFHRHHILTATDRRTGSTHEVTIHGTHL
jgi:hypothetical protein